MRLSLILALIFLFHTSAPATAAKLHIEAGEVLLSRGQGYRPVDASRHLDVGDIVLARVEAKASVSFDDGCSVRLDPGKVFTVQDSSPCKLGFDQNAGATSDWGEATDAVAGADWSASTETVTAGTSATNLLPYLVGAAAVGGIAALVSGGGGGGGAPVSP